jgi:hypothetical protein
VGEIGDETSEALDWQSYLNRYPGAFLIEGGALGFHYWPGPHSL